MKIDLALADSDSLAPGTLGRIRMHSNTDFVVLGAYLATGSVGSFKIRLDLKLQETSGEGILTSFVGNGTESGLSDLVTTTAARLREKLDLGKIVPADAIAVRASVPSTPEALRFYSEGLAHLRSYDAFGARELLEKAVAADPKHALSQLALADAWSSLGYDQKAKDAAKRAFDLSASLPPMDGLLVRGRYHEAMKRWDEAIESYRALWTLTPDDLDSALRLASAETSGGKGKEALAVVEALRKLPAPAKDDPRIDLAEASAAKSLSDWKQDLAAAGAAAAKGRKGGLRLVLARARLLECWALYNLGEPNKSRAAGEEAQRIYAAAGDNGGVAKALDVIANVFYGQGDLAGARKMYEEALATSREIGDKNHVAAALNNIANVLADQGDLSGAKKMYEESLTILREIGDKHDAAVAMSNIAEVLSEQGDLAGAKKAFEPSLAIRREIGDRSGAAETLTNIARVLLGQADLAAAKKSAGEGLALAREDGQKSLSAGALEALAGAIESEGDLAGARRHDEEALGIRETLGETLKVMSTRQALAELSIEEGRAGKAVTAAREAAAFFQKEKDSDSEAAARAILARALLETGDAGAAAKEIARAEALAEKGQKTMARAAIGVTKAQVRAASGKPSDITAAMAVLETLLADARRNGWAALSLEIRLALGSIEVREANPAPGRARLEVLERDAKAAGFGLIARKAAKLARNGATRAKLELEYPGLTSRIE